MSVSINLEVSGLDEFSRTLTKFDDAMEKNVKNQLYEWAKDIKADAQNLVPVQTGYLQSTIYAKSQDWQIQVGAEATYATYVEFGTRYMRAKPYLTPAIEAQLPRLENALLEALDFAKTEAQL
ncbi:MAG: HK97 gp10 family phage protein [Candidatus Bathyarchaeota archaeon]|nr:HK97 gp10 family phage protein [Candidatus Bathyarchaeota archaeon]